MNAGTTEERVARGAALLDERVPGWRERLDVGALDVSSIRNCPVGQAFELSEIDVWDSAVVAYRRALRDLGAPSRGQGEYFESSMYEWAVEHGFDALRVEHTLNYGYLAVTRAWRAFLAA